MSTIVYFGNYLADQLGKPNKSGAICGFIRIALKEEFSPDVANHPSAMQLTAALQGIFKTKLEKLHWENMGRAIESTVHHIRENQSIFTMQNA